MVTRKLNSLYVSAPVNALVTGILREDKTLKQVLEHGNFGLGTFNDLDGEMVLLGGVFYHLHANGTTHIADVDMKTPYACVTHFKPEVSLICNDVLTFDRLNKNRRDGFIEKSNLCHKGCGNLQINQSKISTEARSLQAASRRCWGSERISI